VGVSVVADRDLGVGKEGCGGRVGDAEALEEEKLKRFIEIVGLRTVVGTFSCLIPCCNSVSVVVVVIIAAVVVGLPHVQKREIVITYLSMGFQQPGPG